MNVDQFNLITNGIILEHIDENEKYVDHGSFIKKSIKNKFTNRWVTNMFICKQCDYKIRWGTDMKRHNIIHHSKFHIPQICKMVENNNNTIMQQTYKQMKK